MEEIFAAVGRNLWQEVPMARLNPHDRVFFGDGDRLDAAPDIDQLEAAVSRLHPGDAAGVHRFLADNRYKLQRFRPCLENP